ncbi:MAG: hypothetical protein K2J37_04120 [Ruminococcus sp.]|nr:hypothetical protein [Ruminococcus sp.]MDE6784300.1 hypothetical protein [Ruminococcus sp.]
MKTNNQTGRNYVIIIGIYMLAKAVLNMIIGGGFNLGDVIFAVIATAAMYSGLQYLNIAVAALIALSVVTNMGYNLTHLPSTLIYLIEAVVDAGAVVLLVVQKDIKEHFTNQYSEISSLFRK